MQRDRHQQAGTMQERIEELAAAVGLEPGPVEFQFVSHEALVELAAYGLPGRFHHWTRGKLYERLRRGTEHGFHRIYELAVNARPCRGFLLDTDSFGVMATVMAHVIAHADFFRHNHAFARVPSGMTWFTQLHASRLRHYEHREGALRVERFLDLVLPFEAFVGPRDQDLLLLVGEQSPVLEPWQRDVVGMVRTEALYLQPLSTTRIVNEGWAAFWHTWLVRHLDAPDGAYVDFARLAASVETPPRLAVNPYALGRAVFESIYSNANAGAGPEVIPVLEGSPGRRAIMQARELSDDVSFIRNHLTPAVAAMLDLYIYGLERDRWVVTSRSFEDVREALVLERLNGGVPVIVIDDDDYRGRGELYLVHLYDGRELSRSYAEQTLERLWRLWGNRVYLQTVFRGRDYTLACPPGPGTENRGG